MSNNKIIANKIEAEIQGCVEKMYVTQSAIKIITTIISSHVRLRHEANTPTIMFDEHRNDFYSQFCRLVVLDMITIRRLNGLRTTYASDHNRVVMESRLLLAEFRNAKFVDVADVTGHENDWYLLDERIHGGYAVKAKSRPHQKKINDLRVALAGHPCIILAHDQEFNKLKSTISKKYSV